MLSIVLLSGKNWGRGGLSPSAPLFILKKLRNATRLILVHYVKDCGPPRMKILATYYFLNVVEGYIDIGVAW